MQHRHMHWQPKLLLQPAACENCTNLLFYSSAQQQQLTEINSCMCEAAQVRQVHQQPLPAAACKAAQGT